AKLQKTVAVDNVRYWENANSIRIIVDVSGEVNFTQGDAKDPARTFVDVRPAKLNSVMIGKQWSVNSSLLQQIRVGQYDNSTVRVVLNVGTIDKVTSFTLRDPDRLIIDVLGNGETLAQTTLPAPTKVAAVSTPTTTPIEPPIVEVTAR